MATIKQIAQQVGVSSATVSRVLNNDLTLHVSDETREKVFQVAEQIGYKPRRIARLKEETISTNKKIGLLFWSTQEEEKNDPYFLSVRRGIEHYCQRQHIKLAEIIRGDFDQWTTQLNSLDGLVVVGSILVEDILKRYPYPERMVLVNHHHSDAQIDSIHLNFNQAMKQVVEHFVSLGHQEIAYIGGYGNLHKLEEKKTVATNSEERYEAINSWAVHYGMRIMHEEWVNHWSMQDGYDAMKKLLKLKDRPKACFIASDTMAIGAYRACEEAGISIPQDIEIIGFNNLEVSSYMSPPLTTVHVDTTFLGEQAIKLLLDRLAGRKVAMQIHLQTTLIVRQSTSS